MRRLESRRRKNLLSDILLDLLQRRNVLIHLLLLGGKLVLIGGELPDVSPHYREISCDQLDLLRYFRGHGRLGSFLCAWRGQ
jgi:hypothetical protein